MTRSANNELKGPIRVLLVEDNPGDVFLLTEILSDSEEHMVIEPVDRLAAALARLDAGGIDVVLSDLSLPDSQGIETFEQLHAKAGPVPIIVLSGLNDERMALRTVELGAQDYLVKGQVDQALLVRSIRYSIRRAELDLALQKERNLLRSVIDNLVDAIYVKDKSGHYLLGNVAHAHQLGFHSPEEVIGKTTAELFTPEVARRFLEDDDRVIRTGESIINRHESVSEDNNVRRWLSTTKVPLRDPSGEITGVIGIGRDITSRKLAEEQLSRYTQALKEKNAEMEDDLSMAREVQQAFLPQQFPTFPRNAAPEDSALIFCSKYLPTAMLGGDFFHVVPISDTEAGVFICDVMGHGVRAALVTAMERALVEELTPFASKPGEFLGRMNDALLSILRKTRSPMFASAFYVVIDIEAGKMRYANAGHPRPLHVRRSVNSVVLLDFMEKGPGPALGVFGNSKFRTEERGIEAGDLIVLFTDGLYEVENQRGELYEQALLLQAMKRYVHLPVEQMFERIMEEVRLFSATHSFEDDVCLVGAEICRIMARNSEPAIARSGPISATL